MMETPRDLLIGMYTHVTFSTNTSYKRVTTEAISMEVKTQRSLKAKITNGGHCLTATLRNAFCCIYTHMTSIYILSFTDFDLRNHLRSLEILKKN